MKFNDRGLDLLKKFEGCYLTSYRDTGGIWTIGFGCTHHVAEGLIITMDEAINRLREDIELTADYIRKLLFPHDINDNQFSACVCLAYNIGVGAFSKSTLLNCLRNKNPADAANAFLLWNKVNKEVVEGLTRRREAERELFLSLP